MMEYAGQGISWQDRGFRRTGGAIIYSTFSAGRLGAVRTQGETHLLNRTDRSGPIPGEADVRYLDGDFRVIRPGAFVRCAITGVEIPLEELRYWSVERQEAYASPEAVLQRLGTAYARKK
jgi:hypothetical protein